jgi:hypothetical protein
MSIQWYSIHISLADNTPIFSGFFSVDNNTHIVQTFYDATDLNTDIRSTGSSGGPTYLYYPGWLCFDGGGCNVTSFPYFYGATVGDYNLYGSTNSSTGNHVDGNGNLTYTFAAVSGPYVCFREDTKIRTTNGDKKIQDLRKGDLVLTYRNGFQPIDCIGFRPIQHVPQQERIKDQLYVCKKEHYPELTEDLVVTGCHAILVKDFKEGERVKTIEVLGDTYVTDAHYRLPACVDSRACVYEKEESCFIYHFALENTDYYMNYGVYANGLLVETSSKRYMRELSNMSLID